MEQNIKRKTLSGLIWRYAERCGAQGVSFVVSIVLARLLSPADYGVIGLITVFISISMVFAQSGLGSALVQKKQADDKDFSTVFYFSIIFSLIIYGVLFVLAPLIASFYEETKLTEIIRVLGVTVIIGAINSVQQAYVQKTMQFKKFFYATLGGTVISAIVGIVMAYQGFGVWALVWQQISNQLVNTIVLIFIIKWKPKEAPSVTRIKDLFSFGWKILCSSLLDTVYNNIYSLVIGKMYTQKELGYYNRGKQFPVLIITNLNSAIDSVLFPVLSEVQDDKERLKNMTRRSLRTSTFVVFPAMAGMAAVASPLTSILLTDKWLAAVPFIQFCCFTYAFWPVHTANLNAIKALGRSDIFLKLEILKKLVGIIILAVTLPMGLYAMMWGRCIATLINTVINAFPNKKLFNYGYMEQMVDFMPPLVMSLVMGAIVLLIGLFKFSPMTTLLVQCIVGATVYVAGAKIFRFEAFEYMLNMIKSIKNRK